MPRPSKFPDELRERAIRYVLESERSITQVANDLGIPYETLRKWVRRAEVDSGKRPGLSSDERRRLKELERENFELRRANEILRSASVFFATELGRERPK